MLFNSYIFIFVFLPVAFVGFSLLGARGNVRTAIAWLVVASLFYYGWWNPAYLGLILGSIVFNYGMGLALGNPAAPKRKVLLTVGVGINLALLCYFKYAQFFITATGLPVEIDPIVLPLAISFFTFQQIAYLADAYAGDTRELSFLHYVLFVTFFPQLIAGPIVHHREMLPQFHEAKTYKTTWDNMSIGMTLFIFGLFKKVVLADGIAVYSTPIFAMADGGTIPAQSDAWIAAFAYTFQIYFDFSGYSDMAVGLGRMFGIRLPLNFNSPYKSLSIIEFWRRWHITLSRFLRDYLYIPLGGNRKGPSRRYVNLMTTMLLGGLWHGAGWTFVAWGFLHGFYLLINHGWRKVTSAWITPKFIPRAAVNAASWAVVFSGVVFAWILFRAETFEGAMRMLTAMGGNDVAGIFAPSDVGIRLGVLLIVVLAMPNAIQLMFDHDPIVEAHGVAHLKRSRIQWRANAMWAFISGGLLVWTMYRMITDGYHEFIYRFF